MADLTQPVSKNDYTRGAGRAPITLVMYGDYECPYSRKGNQIVRRLLGKHEGDLSMVFRQFPLRRIHPHAESAARAALAAGEQGQYWAMHDHLFEHQEALDERHILQYAKEVGADRDAFEQAWRGESTRTRVLDDTHSGLNSGVNATPTFFINGERYEGALSVGPLEEAITSVMNRTGS